MSKRINEVSIWNNGQVKVAKYLKVVGAFDDYISYSKSRWSLHSEIVDQDGVSDEGELIAEGLIDVRGQDYIDWGSQPAMDINEWIHHFVANKLNLTII